MSVKSFDLIIVGAGPAGCACAYALRHEPIKIAVIDKDQFPRDKICGDALSADVVNQLFRMDKDLGERFEKFFDKQESHGVRFFAPNGNRLDIDFSNEKHGGAAGYISKREHFDNFFFNQIKDLENVEIFLSQKADQIIRDNETIKVFVGSDELHAPIIIGADGAHSIVNRCLGEIKVEKNHYCAGLRQYYAGVEGFHQKGHIELHFIKDVLPGYLWIFPLPNGEANVGLGMLSSEVSKKKVNLKAKLDQLVSNHPLLQGRFKNARALESVKGYGLPIGSKKRPISGDRFLLLGDAASLIDPFTGEGIGNAIRSGRLAAEHIINCIKSKRFDASYNKGYEKVVYHKMWNELRLSRGLQKLLRFPRLFNFVVRKANKNQSVKLLLTSMLDNVDLKKELVKPSFYLKLLFS
ncbi:NAD(P)/FAD-dependent oxidoreductase [Fulvivirga lutimaris]|uniref:NAD(P)/FAD-dependent oxidoreductase n=1 Tax=Fulvivirga lutimaris TaxID=1819566 RepID=UPI0012BCC054|nr:geranylgeranyl reductase family protein [Fulvivirga lutimaris]MTI41766.1 geranylgeranyl reductase family protein [Fulvivirga lutimaris]